MRARRSLATPLVLALLAGLVLATTVHAEEHAASRDPADSFRFEWGKAALEPGSPEDREKGYRAYLNGEIDALKAELTALHLRAHISREQTKGPDKVCERREMARHYEAEKARLRGWIGQIRQLRGGDASTWFSRLGREISRASKSVWYRIGPFGRKIVREIGNEALETVKSGGTLRGGGLRRLAIVVGRRNAPELLQRALSHKARLADARALAAAQKACEETKETATGPGGAALPGGESGTAGTGTVTPTVAATTCDDDRSYAPEPPYDRDALLVRVAWPPHHGEAKFRYVVTDAADALGDPFGGVSGSNTGGCSDDAIMCGARVPIVLTDAPVEGANVVWGESDGTFTVTVMSMGLCAFSDGEGGAYWAMAPGPVEVTATLEYYRAGEKEPCVIEPLGTRTVPAVDEYQTDIFTTHTSMGSFAWSGTVAGSCRGDGSDEDAPWDRE